MKTSRLFLVLGIALLVIAGTAYAAPTVSNLQHAWLFDGTVGTVGVAGYGTPDAVGTMTLMSNKAANWTPNVSTQVQLYGNGDPLQTQKYPTSVTTTNYSATPFSYVGDKSTLVDFGNWSPTGAYPNRWQVGLGGSGSPTVYTVQSQGAISTWYNPVYNNTAIPVDGYLFTLRDLGTSGNRIYARIHYANTTGNADGDITIKYNGVTTTIPVYDWGVNLASSPAGSPSNSWTNIVVNWGPSGIQAYSNGVAVDMDTSSYTFGSFGVNFFGIGQYSTGGSELPGLYDEFSVWNAPLSSGDISWLQTNSLNSLLSVPEPGTLALLATGLIGLFCYGWRKRK